MERVDKAQNLEYETRKALRGNSRNTRRNRRGTRAKMQKHHRNW